MIDFSIITQYWYHFVRGIFVTLQIAGIGCVMGISLGTLLGFAQSSSSRLLRFFVGVYTTLFRGTPMLIQIAFAVFVLPQLGIGVSDFWAATLAIGFNSAAYLSQIIRSGIASVGKGQVEAARVLGFSYTQTMRLIVLPQAIRVVLPALGNEFITLVKDSSLASTVGVMELSKEGSYIKNVTFDALTVYCIIAVIYLVLTSILSCGVAWLERRMNRSVKH